MCSVRSAPSCIAHEASCDPMSEAAYRVPQAWPSHVPCHRAFHSRGSIVMSHNRYDERRATMVQLRLRRVG